MEQTTKVELNALGKHINAKELPRFQCHKKVWALKIKSVEQHPEIRLMGVVQHPSYAIITFVDSSFCPITWDSEFKGTSKPEAGWYYIVYEDGYRSFAPGQSFESGYNPISCLESSPNDSTESTLSVPTMQDPAQREQQAKITGYRTLSADEITLMNDVKAEGVALEKLIAKLRNLETIDQRWLSIGTTDLQKGLMAVVRSIAKPTTF